METHQHTQPKHLGFKFLVHPTQEMIQKRRRLSEQSCGSDSTGERQLNESFRRMDIRGNSSSTSSDNAQPVHFPKPIRISQRCEEALRKEALFPSLLFEQNGIQKYLSLDNDQKLSDILAKQRDPPKLEHIQRIRTPPILYPFGVPANFDFLVKKGGEYLKEQMILEDERIKERVSRDLFIQKLDISRVNKLSKEEREKKVRLYLEKKRNRQWKIVKYHHRKSLAEQRERVQGRFVKSQRPKYYLWGSEEDAMSHSWAGGSTSSAGERKLEKDLCKQVEALRKSSDH